MAGLGRKTFIATEVLTAANVNGYLMDQSVMKFASSAARSSAIGTAVSEGMVSYLADTDALEVYNGSAWGAVSSAGSGNAIINGAFDIWQRGAGTFSANGITADRWGIGKGGTSTIAISQQTFTPGTAPVSGYESQYYLRFARTNWNATDYFGTKIEDVRTFAGQTVTLSFWAKAAAGFTSDGIVLNQNFGSGGSSSVETNLTAPTFTTSWARYTFTVTLPSIAGKTIGTGSYLEMYMKFNSNAANMTFDLWGVQLESGSTATTFQRNAPSLQAELAACQRYYEKIDRTGFVGICVNNYNVGVWTPFKVVKRTSPTVAVTADYQGGFSTTASVADTAVNGTMIKRLANSTSNDAYWFSIVTADSEL